MRYCSFLALIFISNFTSGQEQLSPFDGRYWGVVFEHPDTKKVTVKENIEYTKLSRSLRLDVYLPIAIGATEKRPTIVLMNGVGDQPGQPPLKNSPGQTSWARLLAAHGFVVVTMEAEVNKIQESFAALFQCLADRGAELHVDVNSLGVQAFSANCREVILYIMSKDAFAGIKAAALYYGEPPQGLLRDDLPVLFVVAELDIRGRGYADLWSNVLKNRSPWTITLARDMPHAFDFFSDTDISRRIILSTISFWEDQLRALPARTSTFSKEREIVAATYDHDQSRKLALMREWMNEHPNSTDAYALSAYASALMGNREYAEAEKYLAKAMASAPKNIGNYLMMTVISYALGKNAEGDKNLAIYEKATTPEAFTYFYVADRLRAVKKYERAASLYERALQFPNPPGFLFYNLGVTYALMGYSDKAFQNLSKAVAMGFGTKESYEANEDLTSLHGDKRWSELLGGM